MAQTVRVNPTALTAQARQIAALAEEVRRTGRQLTAVGRPELGGSDPAYDVVNEIGTQVSSTATWVMTCASALAALADAALQAAEAYRATEEEAATRWAAMSAAFAEFDEMYGLMTGPV